MEGGSDSGYTRDWVSRESNMSEATRPELPDGLLRAARRTRARLRVMAGLTEFAKWMPVGVLFLTPWALSYRFELISGTVLTCAAGSTLLAWVAVVVRAVRRGPGLLEATLRLDGAHDLRGRLAAALEYAGAFSVKARPSPGEESYMSLTLDDARTLGPLDAPKAAPLDVPRGVLWGSAMTACFVLLLLFPDAPAPPPPGPLVPVPTEQQATWLSEDDAELLTRASRDLEEVAKSEEAKSAAERFNEIVLRAAAGEIDQGEAFRLAAELEADLEAAGQEANELVDGLNERGASLERRSITRALGRALQEREFKEAEEALEKLAERLSSEKQPLSEKELEELRASLEEARGQIENKTNPNSSQEQAAAEERQRLEERQKRLLQKKQEGKATKADEREMAENERRLKRLDRQKKQRESAQKTLSDLDKQLAEAARELQQEQKKKSGEFLDRAADTLKEGVQKQLSDEEKKELIKQLKALKERLRRQNERGDQAERLREFLKRARGQQGEQSGQQGQPKPGQGGTPRPGEVRLGPGGAPLPVPGQAEGQGQGQGEGQGEQPGTGKEAGKSHDPNLSGDESRLDGAGTEDTTAVAQDTGQGQSASETILGVAEEGFTSSSYESLYREYQTVAEEVMEKETVPVGRRAHVLRYFELIRPRGQSRASQGEK